MKNYIKDFSKFNKIDEATTSEDLLTKASVAEKMIGTTPAEISAAFKKFQVKDSKGKSLGVPSSIKRNDKNDIYLSFAETKPQLFDYAEKISASYNGKPLGLTSKLIMKKSRVSGKPYCQVLFAYEPKGLPGSVAIFVNFWGSKMETAMQAGGGGSSM